MTKVLAWEQYRGRDCYGDELNSFGNSQQLHVSMGPFPSLESTSSFFDFDLKHW